MAAGVYVLSKVFENQVNRLTSAVYIATGTWDDPEVKFDRVFDDTEGSAAETSSAAPDERAAVKPVPAQPVSP